MKKKNSHQTTKRKNLVKRNKKYFQSRPWKLLWISCAKKNKTSQRNESPSIWKNHPEILIEYKCNCPESRIDSLHLSRDWFRSTLDHSIRFAVASTKNLSRTKRYYNILNCKTFSISCLRCNVSLPLQKFRKTLWFLVNLPSGVMEMHLGLKAYSPTI